MSKRIGILTWFFGINYGARAHSLALQKTVESLGYDCEFINYQSCNNWRIELHTCCMAGNLKRHPFILIQGMQKWLKFRIQLNSYPCSKRVYNVSEIETLGYDAMIIGSDEILNLNHDLASKLYYSVGFSQNCPEIMYAASAGTVDPETILDDDCQIALKNINALSARDTTSKELLERNSGRKVEIVLDPTLLYNFESRKQLCADKYMLIYSFGSLSKERQRIVDFARSRDLKIICVGRKCEWADKSYPTADLEEWLAWYEHASYIVTDSYHGLIFALKNHKDFILVQREDKTNKIDGLRDILSVDRSTLKQNESIVDYLSKPLDYKKIDSAIEQEKDHSLKYLKENLEEAVRK